MVDLLLLLLELSSHFGENKGLMLIVDGGWKRQLSCVTAETAAAVLLLVNCTPCNRFA